MGSKHMVTLAWRFSLPYLNTPGVTPYIKDGTDVPLEYPLFQACYASIGRNRQHSCTFIVLVNHQGIQIKPHFQCNLSTLYQFIGCVNDISDLLYAYVF